MKPGVLTFYRVMAYVTAVLLILLCLAMVLKYSWATGTPTQDFGDTWTTAIGIAHGYLYLVYLFIALVITVQLRVPVPWMLLVLLAGTVPLGAFFAERKVTRWFHLRQEGLPLQADESGAGHETRSANS